VRAAGSTREIAADGLQRVQQDFNRLQEDWLQGCVANSQALFERKEAYAEAGNSATRPIPTRVLHCYRPGPRAVPCYGNAKMEPPLESRVLIGMCDAYLQGDLNGKPTIHPFASVLNPFAYSYTLRN
jgi:hypothetical protein